MTFPLFFSINYFPLKCISICVNDFTNSILFSIDELTSDLISNGIMSLSHSIWLIILPFSVIHWTISIMILSWACFSQIRSNIAYNIKLPFTYVNFSIWIDNLTPSLMHIFCKHSSIHCTIREYFLPFSIQSSICEITLFFLTIWSNYDTITF